MSHRSCPPLTRSPTHDAAVVEDAAAGRCYWVKLAQIINEAPLIELRDNKVAMSE
jgi:hypothetical protein